MLVDRHTRTLYLEIVRVEAPLPLMCPRTIIDEIPRLGDSDKHEREVPPIAHARAVHRLRLADTRQRDAVRLPRLDLEETRAPVAQPELEVRSTRSDVHGLEEPVFTRPADALIGLVALAYSCS